MSNNTFTGTDSQFWSDPGNWSAGAVPTNGSNAQLGPALSFDDIPLLTLGTLFTAGDGLQTRRQVHVTDSEFLEIRQHFARGR